MIEAFWIPLLPPYLIGLVLSFAVEALLTPRPVAPWRRPVAAVGVHVGVWTLAFALELMLFRRPYFAVANVLAIELLIVLVSNAKYQALREPFVYPDFEYFLDAVKHPRLYLPFFGVWRAMLSGGGYGVALWVGLSLEDSVTAGAGVWFVSFADLPQEHMFDPIAPAGLFFLHSVGLALLGLALTKVAVVCPDAPVDASADLRRMGLFAALWNYFQLERRPTAGLKQLAPFNIVSKPLQRLSVIPDLVVVQSESFFDVRRAYPQVGRGLLANFDQLKSESVMHGQLSVAAWGANTVRTEFSFLSGMSAAALGVHQYNPYRRLATGGFPTVASYLKSLGYRTVCIHPYYGGFYRRDKILPLLGFEEFLDISHFAGDLLDGQYIGDRALTDRVVALLGKSGNRPLYLHVITMENHGPLHWESVDKGDERELMTQPLPGGCDELLAYCRHLGNADAMFGALRRYLLDRSRPAGLCIFGDHVPIMPGVYKQLGAVDGTTDYLIWHSRGGQEANEVPLSSAALSGAFLEALELWSPMPIAAKGKLK
ncbi:LTA synthase family protein [Achromobacter sp. NPDC008082]|uniref:LTA synthase family protein n=1 Tax=Achromobacter sp. NPDC008082 TaxID=3363888 RepID=UPI0036E56FBA